MTATQIAAELGRRGFTVRVTERGTFVVRPLSRVDEGVLDLLRAYRAALRRERHDDPCDCATLGEHLDRRGSYEAWIARARRPPATDHAFVAVASIDRTAAELAVCIACGLPWDLHGRPAFSAWRLVNDADTVALVDARAVVAGQIASAIAAEHSAP